MIPDIEIRKQLNQVLISLKSISDKMIWEQIGADKTKEEQHKRKLDEIFNKEGHWIVNLDPLEVAQIDRTLNTIRAAIYHGYQSQASKPLTDK